jgi:hypothetical protein
MSLTVAEFADAFRKFLDAVNQTAVASPLLGRISDHLGIDARTAPVLTEELATYEHPTLQRALDAQLSGARYQSVGLSGAVRRFMSPTISDLLSGHGLSEGPLDWVNVRLAGDETLPCVQSGLFLVTSTELGPYAIFISGAVPGRSDSALTVDVVAADRSVAEAVLARLRADMERLDVYRGQVLSVSTANAFGMRGPTAQLTFYPRPDVARDDVVLPAAVLDRIDRHTVDFSRHADALRAAGQSLRRGVLLYGAPGVGKTLTARYLTAQLRDRTVLLLTGLGVGALPDMARLARRLAPSLVIIEDVDLIAEERTIRPRSAGTSFLFELLNEMDGLREDTDVVFLLTTNRPDVLEPALALRPGRIDMSVELPLPDAEGRRRVFALYGRQLDLSAIDLQPYVDRCDGASPAFIRELLRQAALRAVEAGRATGSERARLEPSDLDGAMEDLALGGDLAQRLLGGVAPPLPATPAGLPPGFTPPPGFPARIIIPGT